MIQIDMEMPESCYECPLRDDTYNFCPFFDLRGGEDWTDNLMRPSTCPLVEVKEEADNGDLRLGRKKVRG